MRILQDPFIEKGLSKVAGREIDRKNTRARDKQKEQLTDRELAYQMGTNRPTYGRAKGGAFRQR